MNRPKLIAANWKLQKTLEEAKTYFRDFSSLADKSVQTIFFPSPVLLSAVVTAIQGKTNLAAGAQNISEHASGAFTGETSAEQVRSVGGKWILVGHSERRQYFGESSALTAKKIKAVVAAGLKPLLCVGETLSERESGQTEHIIAEQLKAALAHQQLKDLAIAYEPVWAIGTGKVATPEMASEAHRHLREILDGEMGLKNVPILYGGSVKSANAGELLQAPYIDGLLVGGASLIPDEFAQIVNAAREKSRDTETR